MLRQLIQHFSTSRLHYEFSKCTNFQPNSTRMFGTTSYIMERDKSMYYKNLGKSEEGTVGEKGMDIDVMQDLDSYFPTLDSNSRLFNGVRYDELPIVHVTVSRNNTLICITDYKANVLVTGSCGTEGFKNARKKTTVACQATGLNIGVRAVQKGLAQVRVCVKGLGPGRFSAIKGLEMSGLDIVSLTDTTPIPNNGPKPRKPKRL